jgi:hypothetical protein
METLTHSSGLFTAAKRHWRHFILAWLFPVFLYASWLVLPITQRNAFAWFIALDLPIFWIAGYVATTPYRRRLVSMPQAGFWVVLMPIVIWCLLVFLPFALRARLSRQMQ